MCYCTVLALFYFEFEGNFQEQALGGLYLEGRFNGGFFALRVWGTYIYRGLFFGILWYMYRRRTHANLVQPRYQSFDPFGQRCGSKGSRLRD